MHQGFSSMKGCKFLQATSLCHLKNTFGIHSMLLLSFDIITRMDIAVDNQLFSFPQAVVFKKQSQYPDETSHPPPTAFGTKSQNFS